MKNMRIFYVTNFRDCKKNLFVKWEHILRQHFPDFKYKLSRF